MMYGDVAAELVVHGPLGLVACSNVPPVHCNWILVPAFLMVIGDGGGMVTAALYSPKIWFWDKVELKMATSSMLPAKLFWPKSPSDG